MQPDAIRELDPGFKYEIASQPGGEYLKRCFACGACSGGCLISDSTAEFDPRKIIRMALLGMRERVLSSPAIWLCLLCHNCSFHCPQDVRFSNVIGALRYLAVREGYVSPSFLRMLAFKVLLPSQARLELFSRSLATYQMLKLPALLRKLKVLDALPERLQSLEYLLPPVPAIPLRRRIAAVIPASGRTRRRVGFFMGCADSLVFADAGLATVSLLSALSCEVVTPKATQCCGMPFVGYGELERARRLARHNIDVFAKGGIEAVITDCATCGSFLRGYADLLKDDAEYAGRALAFSSKVQDISEFLVQDTSLTGKLHEISAKVTYHDSCHLNWGQKVSRQPRELLKLIPGLELVEMKEADTCCGGAGSYNLTHYGTSMAILDRKMANIAATGAGLIATGCPGCHIQLRLGVKRRGMSATVVHPVELLRQAYFKA